MSPHLHLDDRDLMMLLIAAIAILVTSGGAALLLSRAQRLGSAIAVGGVIAAAACGARVAVGALLTTASSAATTTTLSAPWRVPFGALRVAIDPLSGFFLLPIFVLSALTAVYGRAYLMPHAGKKALGFAWFAFNMLVASMVMVVIARQAILFLVAWEVMSLAAYVLVTFEHEHDDVRRAGFVYLIATHLATAFLIAMFLLLGHHAQSFDFDAIQAANASAVPQPNGGDGGGHAATTALSATLFALALVGFGVKAGIVPFHVWLPEAHAAAPSHVSALMSGVLIKMGIYGLLRALWLLGHPASWWGPLLIVVGLVSGVLGIAVAMYQRDIKRALAYSSIENVGLIFVGLGTGFWGVSSGMPHVAAFGMLGALLHIYNHALVKGLLFLSAGSVLHGTGTKDLEKLGGVYKRMPRTATLMVIGAVALSALPPLNGFVSEWLLYRGLLEGGIGGIGSPVGGGGGGVGGVGFGGSTPALFAIGIVSLIGALTLLCFVRLIGIGLLGEPRSALARDAHESPSSMTVPMALLALAAIGLAIFPQVAVTASSYVVAELLGSPANTSTDDGGSAVASVTTMTTATSALVASMGTLNAFLFGAIALGTLGFSKLLLQRRRHHRAGERASTSTSTTTTTSTSTTTTTDSTWACGYARPSSRMQYTARSFAELMSERLLPKRLRARSSTPFAAAASKHAIFAEPRNIAVSSEFSDPLTRDVYEPALVRWGHRFARLRWVQQGMLHVYLIYIAVVMLLALAWVSLRAWSGR